MTASEVQPDLISPEQPLYKTELVSPDSSKRAYYIVSVVKIRDGYVIQKESGASKAKPQIETYWRPGLRLALEKYKLLLKAKLCKQKGRLYNEVALERGNEKQNSSGKN